MKLQSRNFSGTLGIEYKIKTRRLKESEFVMVELHLRLPGTEEFTFFDSVAWLEGTTYPDNLQVALIKAENKWNLNLLKFKEELINI